MSDLYSKFGIDLSAGGGLVVSSPLNGVQIGVIAADDAASVEQKVRAASVAQREWQALSLEKRSDALLRLADVVESSAAEIAEIINIESGKTLAEAEGEVGNFSTTIRTTVEKAAAPLEDLGSMQRRKIHAAVGNVGLITSFNFPLAVAGWNISPAMLAGNSVVWKPSEKTPLTALAVKSLFDKVDDLPNDLLQILVGEVDVGVALVENEQIGMVSATGSVAMGNSIARALSGKKGNKRPPIIEAGGNNGVVISANNSVGNLQFAVDSISKSFLGTAGQRCTNTRRLFVAEPVLEQVMAMLEAKLAAAKIDTPLVDEAAYDVFANACSAAKEQGGEIMGGGKAESDGGFYVNPAIVKLPTQSEIMHEECFGPLLFVVPFADFSQALKMVSAPQNAGLVNGVYTQSRAEVDAFVQANEAGHCVVNAPNGTGTPAHGMGFGGNKESGIGEILNQQDPLRAFSLGANRVALNLDIELN